MASFSPKQLRLKVQTAQVRKEKDLAFYLVPPVLVAALFAFCAYVPRSVLSFNRGPAVKVVSAQKTRVELPDPNTSLPGYEMPEGCSNLLRGATAVRVSAAVAESPALNAVNGSSADDANVAVAQPTGNSAAWWQVDMPRAAAGRELVIYGGGSKSPAGKFVGGFSVEVEYEGGEKTMREFCREGFALEGFETMKLNAMENVKRIRVTSLGGTPVVLREVQLIGRAD